MKDQGTVSEPDRNVQDPTRSHNWTPEAVKRLRLSKRISQQQLADLLNVQRATISGWENGKTWPTDVNAAVLDSIATEAGAPSAPLTASVSAALQGRAAEVEALMAFALERQRRLVQALSGSSAGTDPRVLAADAPMPTERDAGRGTAPAAGAPPRAPRRARGL